MTAIQRMRGGYMHGVRMSLTLGLWLVAGVVGAIQFWLVQVLTGGPTITAFMGDEIVAAGGYPTGFAPFVGWLVHVAVSLAYALLFGAIVMAISRAPFSVRAVVALVAALVLASVTAVIAPPAISVTIALLGGRGWPEELLPLNLEIGLPLWNHVGFFVVSWLIQAIAPRLLAPPAAVAMAPKLSTAAITRRNDE